MPLASDLRQFIESLNSARVEYVIVGSYALAYYGSPRYTGDIDILVRPSVENATRVAAAIAQFGFGSLGTAGKQDNWTVSTYGSSAAMRSCAISVQAAG